MAADRLFELVVLLVLVCRLPAVAADVPGASERPRGRIGILRAEFPHRPAHADPGLLWSALTESGFTVRIVDSAELTKIPELTAADFDCIVFPYGPTYPSAACETIKRYLKSGGSFLSMGGYAFDDPQPPDESKRLNTRFGRHADTMGLDPDQIGVFDPSYHLKHAVTLKAAPGQFVIPPKTTIRGLATGYAACSMLGSNNPVFPDKWGRHIPLLEAYDSFGRPRGSAGAIAHNYAGPYAGSSWAFFGVTNRDLFAKRSPLLPHVGEIVDAVVAKTFLHSLSTDLACYRDGELVNFTCKAANLGKRSFAGSVVFRVYDRAGKKVFASRPSRVSLSPGDTQTLQDRFRLKAPACDLYRVTADLVRNGRMVDTIETGFAAYNEKVTSAGLPLEYRDNYFHVGDRPVLLSGTNATGAIFCSGNENPLVWDRDLARMNDNGLNILRVLHFSPFVSDTPTPTAVKPIDLAIDRLPLATERKLDALVQLCQKHRIVLLLSIHDWMPVELTDEELAAQRRFAELIAARYKDVPGFMIDIQNEPHIDLPRERKDQPDHLIKLWNDHLRTKYGSDEALRAAWTKSPPEGPIGSIPYRAGTDSPDDARTFDADAFRNVLLNRWARANFGGAKEGDPNVPVTIGFLQEYWALNKLACTEWVDFANMHSYNTIDVLRCDLKLFDRRFQGKSISLGEFGALPDHDRRTHGQDNPDQDYERYLLTGHYLFGEGGSFIANWCWKDMDDVVFPWGINHTCGGPPKDILKAYRNQSLLMRQIRPVYKPPAVFLVVPLDRMMGGGSGDRIRSVYGAIDSMLDARIDLGVIDDRHVSLLPSSSKAVTYEPGFRVPDELLRSDCRVGASAGHAFRIPEFGGGRAIILVNPKPEAQAATVLEGTVPLEVTLAPNGVGLVRYDASGQVLAVESNGLVKIGSMMIPASGHFALVSCDGRPIASPRRLVLVPFGGCAVDIGDLSGPADLVVETGEVVEGKWVALEESTDTHVRAAGPTAFDIRIISRRADLTPLGRWVASELMLDK